MRLTVVVLPWVGVCLGVCVFLLQDQCRRFTSKVRTSFLSEDIQSYSLTDRNLPTRTRTPISMSSLNGECFGALCHLLLSLSLSFPHFSSSVHNSFRFVQVLSPG